MPKYPETEFNFEADLAIDKHSLDTELLTQAQKMMRYSAAHAQAQFDRDRAKQALDVTKANLDASIRKELTDQQVKFTEAVVDGKIRTAPNFLEEQSKFQDAEYKVNLLMGAVMAMNARKVALENLVRLFLSGYWADPRVQGGGTLKAEATQDAMEAAILRSQLPTENRKPIPRVGPPTPKTT